MKRNITTYISLVLMAVLATGCSKDPALIGTLSSQIALNTQTVSSIGQNSGVSGVQTSGGFSGDIVDKGICWATTSNPTTDGSKLSGGPGIGFVALSPTGLTPGTAYYIRGYAITKNETIYGDQKQFNTLGYQLATLTTTAVTNLTLTTALGGGNVTAQGGGAVTAKGICWNTDANPTILNSRTSDGAGLGAYSSSLSGLTPGTVYYVRAYATNQAGTVYGTQVSFTTVSIALATVSSTTIGLVTQTTAASSASVTAAGGGTVTARGICWSTVSGPTVLNTHTIDGTGLGAYTSVMSGLSAGVTYYVRAYATNEAGTVYGPQSGFTTTVTQLATVSAVTISGITKTAATVSGSVTADGGGTISSRGVCWSTGTNPTVLAGSAVSNGSGTGAVSGALTGLVTGTTYYVRAYAVNAAGTSYGALTSFRTL